MHNKIRRAVFLLLLSFFATVAALPGVAADQQKPDAEAARIYEEKTDAVFQIIVTNKSSNEKSVLGSGFRISGNNQFITNYHVVSDAVKYPPRH